MTARRYYGKYRGTVAQNIDPMLRGRIQCIVPDVFGVTPTGWAMPCFPFAGPQMGSVAIPTIGAGVWVEFEQGDPDYPIWVGCFWDQAGDVPASPPIAEMKVLKTDAATVTIADGPGPASVAIETQAGMKILLGAQGIEIDDGQGGTVKLQGPKVSINGTALEVT